MAKNSNVWTQ